MATKARTVEQELATPSELVVRFRLGRTTIFKYLGEMRKSEEYKDYVYNPAYRKVLVDIKGFRAYLRSINYRFLKG